MRPLTVAVVGAGYWGPNLIRNFTRCDDTDLQVVCDLDRKRAQRAVGPRSTVRVTTDLDEVLSDDGIDAVALATPARTHASIATACIEAGKHLLVEKPLAATVAEGERLVALADRHGVVLMCDHTYCYTPVVEKLRDLIAQGVMGELLYVDSVRINLGLVQPDVDVFWDLAPHDLSILDYILPAGCGPESVAAQGADPLHTGRPSVGHLTIRLHGGAMAHMHVNWLSPTKIRKTVVGGSRRMAVWDDLDPTQRLSVYDKGVDMRVPLSGETRREQLVSYRTGDMIAPVLPEGEALQGVVRELAASVREGRQPRTDGRAGLRVLRMLDAVPRSIASGGTAVPFDAPLAAHDGDGVVAEMS